MNRNATPQPISQVAIGLNAVIAAVEKARPLVLCVRRGEHWALPYGRFDPDRHRTFELGMRDLVEKQTKLKLGFVEQLYTFGDKGRESPSAVMAEGADTDRIISVGYLGLTATPEATSSTEISWRNWYEFFPWEDWGQSDPKMLISACLPALNAWASSASTPAEIETRHARLRVMFGLEGFPWEEERVLQRYELMYEAGIVAESWRDRGGSPPAPLATALQATGPAMASDHRRILATAIGRLRGKLRYRPVIFDLMAKNFTLLALQNTVEGIIGFTLHKQNFRRGIENSGLIEKTDLVSSEGAGRPAALFTLQRGTRSGKELQDRSIQGLTLPRMRG